MPQNKPQLYVGCALRHAPQEFRNQVEQCKTTLRAKGYEVFDFLGLDGGTPREVYDWDIGRCVANCTLFVAICDLPSLGLGYELATAVERYNKPVLAVAHHDASVSRLVEGIRAPHFSFERYQDLLKELPALVEAKLAALDPRLKSSPVKRP